MFASSCLTSKTNSASSKICETLRRSGYDVPFVPLSVVASDYVEGATAVIAALEAGHRKKKDAVKQDEEKLQFQKFSDAYTNLVVKVSSSLGDYVLRVYGHGTDRIISREEEVLNTARLVETGLVPKIVGLFENGICLECVEGVQLSLEDMRDGRIGTKVAAAMAKLHFEGQRFKSDDAEEVPLLHTTYLGSWLDLVPESMSLVEDTRRLEEIKVEFGPLSEACKHMLEVVARTRSPLALCHNDLQCGNILHCKRTDRLWLIDMEYCGINYRGFDIADYFSEFAGMEIPDYSFFPNREDQLHWLRAYLEESATLRGADPTLVSEREVEELYWEVQHFVPACHLTWGIWALYQAKHSKIDYDFLWYGKIRLVEYRKQLLRVEQMMK